MAKGKQSIFKQFSSTFWVANTMELLERWAFYGVFMVMALYLTGSRDTGALGFSDQRQGMLMGTITSILYFLPIITGAIADRIGYKKVLLLSFIIVASSYILMAFVESYYAVYFVFLLLALGAGLFKPVISATIAKTTNKKTSSIGFGIFYMMVNLGAFIGPFVASKARHSNLDTFSFNGWQLVFFVSASVILANIILLLIFFKEPEREKSTESIFKSIKQAFVNIYFTLKDWKFLIFLVLIVGFWAMYFQLFFSLPKFIDQWMDTSLIYNWIASFSPNLANVLGTNEGTIAAEMLTNIDALYIVIFQILVSSIVMKIKPISAMITGIFVSSIGIGLTFAFNNPFFLFFSILIFGLGEMASSPKISEYIGRIAPKDKVGLYMGASFLPLAGGTFLAGILSGRVYGKMSDKFSLLQLEVDKRALDIPQLSNDFTKNDYFAAFCEKTGMTNAEMTSFLWNTYEPQRIWIVFTLVGMITVVGLLLYDKLLKGKINN